MIGAYFSSKMIRLVLILSPAACVNAGAFLGGMIQVTLTAHREISAQTEAEAVPKAAAASRPATAGVAAAVLAGPPVKEKKEKPTGNPKKPDKQKKAPAKADAADELPSLSDEFNELRQARAVRLTVREPSELPCECHPSAVRTAVRVPSEWPSDCHPTGHRPHSPPHRSQVWEENVDTRRTCGLVTLLVFALLTTLRFYPHCWGLGQQLSEPQIMLRGRDTKGAPVIIDDFREAYAPNQTKPNQTKPSQTKPNQPLSAGTGGCATTRRATRA